jgi:uncharacterized membrane protein YdjX (TVP38/TMEM64 family)
MTVTSDNVLWVMAAASAASSALFWAIFYAGRAWQKLMHAHERLDDHAKKLNDHGELIGELLGRRRGDGATHAHPHPYQR